MIDVVLIVISAIATVGVIVAAALSSLVAVCVGVIVAGLLIAGIIGLVAFLGGRAAA